MACTLQAHLLLLKTLILSLNLNLRLVLSDTEMKQAGLAGIVRVSIQEEECQEMVKSVVTEYTEMTNDMSHNVVVCIL